ncbi:MAG: hypothetical protein IJA26_08480 [Clostridia bacterium]|nr:hypothetical protein [Clostridia bacterium]
MNDIQKNTTFQYTYSANEQEELKRIRSKYVPKEENKMDLLRRLDAQVYQKATMYAIIVGVIGALILGTGMSCCMVWGGAVFVLGIIVGIIGLAVVGLAYPLYNRTLKKERERIAPEILRLADELMK